MSISRIYRLVAFVLSSMLALGLSISPASASETGSIKVSKSQVSTSVDSVLEVELTIELFSIRSVTVSCGEYISINFDQGKILGYRIQGGNSRSVPSYQTNHRRVFADPIKYPWARQPTGENVNVKEWYKFLISIPKNTITRVAECNFLADVTTHSGEKRNINLNNSISFVSGPGNVSRFEGGDVINNFTLKKSDSPFRLTSPIRLAENATFTVEAGVEILVVHSGTVFSGGREIRFLGTTSQPVIIRDARTLWEKSSGDFFASHTIFSNFGAFSIPYTPERDRFTPGRFTLLDSFVLGRSDRTLFDAWSTPRVAVTLRNNYFEGITGFTFPNTSSTLEVSGNWFEGNSLLDDPLFGSTGAWLNAQYLTTFRDNSFSNFSFPVVFKRFPKKPRGNSSVPNINLRIGPNFFMGLSAVDAGRFVSRDLVFGPAYSISGYVLDETQRTPSKPRPIPPKSFASNPSIPPSSNTNSGQIDYAGCVRGLLPSDQVTANQRVPEGLPSLVQGWNCERLQELDSRIVIRNREPILQMSDASQLAVWRLRSAPDVSTVTCQARVPARASRAIGTRVLSSLNSLCSNLRVTFPDKRFEVTRVKTTGSTFYEIELTLEKAG